MLINKYLLDKVSSEAKRSQRLRMNFNFHDSLESPSQRLLNALEPGTKIPIHRHKTTSETYIILRGKMRLSFYDNDGKIIESVILCSDTENIGYNIPKGQWHTLEVLVSNTVIFEVKDGPYQPLNEEDILK